MISSKSKNKIVWLLYIRKERTGKKGKEGEEGEEGGEGEKKDTSQGGHYIVIWYWAQVFVSPNSYKRRK
jgi:hypothetical protein